MRKRFLAALWIIPALCSASAQGAPQIKNIKIAISNPGDHARKAADIVIPIAQLRKIAPDFTPGSMIVTASDASTLEQDASVLQTEELPAQVDDLDGDGKGDELAFQIDLAPHQTRIVTVSYGNQERIWRLRGDYQQRTAALFSPKNRGSRMGIGARGVPGLLRSAKRHRSLRQAPAYAAAWNVRVSGLHISR